MGDYRYYSNPPKRKKRTKPGASDSQPNESTNQDSAHLDTSDKSGADKSTSAAKALSGQNTITHFDTADGSTGSGIAATRKLNLSTNWWLALTGGSFVVLIAIALLGNLNGEGYKVAESFNLSQTDVAVKGCTKDSETTTVGRLEYSYWQCATEGGEKWCVEKIYDPVTLKLRTENAGTESGKCASLT